MEIVIFQLENVIVMKDLEMKDVINVKTDMQIIQDVIK